MSPTTVPPRPDGRVGTARTASLRRPIILSEGTRMRTLHSTHGFHFADLSDKYAKQHPDGVHFTYDQAATIKAAEKAPTGIAARVYKFETNIDALAETLLDLDDLDDYDIEEVIVRVKRDKAETPDDDEPDDAPAAKKAAAPAKKAAAPRKAAASGAKARTSSK